MKKTLVALMLVALAVPAMADVAITGVDEGSQNLAIYADSTAVMRGVALKLTITGGNLAAATDYLASDFNTFVDYAFSTAGYTIGTGHPIANAAAAGVATFPATVASVSVGYLDQAGAQAGLTGKKLVARLHISGIAVDTSASVAIVADTLRGGAVVGDTIGAVTIVSPVAVKGPESPKECVKNTAPFYATWVAWGKPNCWCFKKQCNGDINGTSLAGKPVTTADLNTFKLAFNVTDAVLATVANGICADLNHAALAGKRVTTADLNTFKLYFNLADASVPVCDMTNYNFWTN